MKTRYRDLLDPRQLEGIEESSVASKRIFLDCYQLARKEGLSERNICSGFKAGGLWPVNISKPLMSRHLIANNKAYTRGRAPFSIPGPLTAQGATLEDYSHEIAWVATLEKAREIRAILYPVRETTPTKRL